MNNNYHSPFITMDDAVIHLNRSERSIVQKAHCMGCYRCPKLLRTILGMK